MNKINWQSLHSIYEGLGQKLRPMNTKMDPKKLNTEFKALMNGSLKGDEALSAALDWYVKNSVPTEDPRFMNQLWSGQSKGGVLAEGLGAAANTSMYTFEVAPAATLIEKHCLELLAKKAGFSSTEGTFVPGGSYGNMLGLVLARQSRFKKSKAEGQPQNLAVFCSEESHYSISKAAIIMGFGTDNVIKVPTDERGRMKTNELKLAIQKTIEQNKTPFAVIATAGTTVRGSIDPIDEVSTVCAESKLWLHVDGALGGSLLFSDKLKGKLKGVEKADSMTWNIHKLMGVPIHCSAFLSNREGSLADSATLSTDETSYIFRDENSLDLGPFSFQCGRKADSLKMWLALVEEGEQGFSDRAESIVEKAHYIETKINESDEFELVCPVESVNVCFQYNFGTGNIEAENALNKEIRENLLGGDELAINYGMVKDKLSIRFVPFNPNLGFKQIDEFLEILSKEGKRVKSNM